MRDTGLNADVPEAFVDVLDALRKRHDVSDRHEHLSASTLCQHSSHVFPCCHSCSFVLTTILYPGFG